MLLFLWLRRRVGVRVAAGGTAPDQFLALPTDLPPGGAVRLEIPARRLFARKPGEPLAVKLDSLRGRGRVARLRTGSQPDHGFFDCVTGGFFGFDCGSDFCAAVHWRSSPQPSPPFAQR